MGHWHQVFVGAWDKSCKSLGWNKEKIVGVTVVFVGTIVVNGMRAGFDAVGNAKSILVGLLVVAPFIFLVGMIQTWWELNRGSDARQVQRWTERDVEAKPDYGKWGFKQIVDLKTAAQLWSGEMPEMRLSTKARETYEMLRGAVQDGQLQMIYKENDDIRLRDIWNKKQRDDAGPQTQVSRKALRTFAEKNGFDPDFLKE
jgi:hypothetical protein